MNVILKKHVSADEVDLDEFIHLPKALPPAFMTQDATIATTHLQLMETYVVWEVDKVSYFEGDGMDE